MDRPVCVACISEKSGLGIRKVESYLNRIERAVDVLSGVDRCRVCGNPTTVYSVTRRD